MSGFAIQVDAARNAGLLSPADALQVEGRLVWIHLDHAELSTHHWLTATAGIGELAADALTATETRPRCDAIGSAAILNLRGLSPSMRDSMSDPLASVRILADGCRVISVTRHAMSALETVREAGLAGKLADPGDLIAALADAITEELDPVVSDLGDEIDDCEGAIDERRLFDLRRMVSAARARAIGYRRFLSPQRAALEKLAGLPADWLAEDDRAHLAASADRAARMAEELDAIRDRAALLHETLTDLRAEQIDQRALTLSIVALVFLPLTFLTGLLGMNVEGIPFAHEPWAFDGVVALCTVAAVGITAYFMRRHWF